MARAKKIVFVRHAHRHKLQTEEDNGLSEKGANQVARLVQLYKEGELPSGHVFWTSPKKRCKETLKPLALQAEASLTIEDLLDEQRSDETSKDFQKRIEKLMKKVSTLDETIYLCSHGDLIPEAINFLSGTSVDLSKGEAVIMTEDDGHWRLE